jgi:hypothetical protein
VFLKALPAIPFIPVKSGDLAQVEHNCILA